MTAYGFRNNKLKADVESNVLTISKKQKKKSACYIELQASSVTGRKYYLYIGTAGHLMLSSTAPVGTSGAFADTGTRLGTAA